MVIIDFITPDFQIPNKVSKIKARCLCQARVQVARAALKTARCLRRYYSPQHRTSAPSLRVSCPWFQLWRAMVSTPKLNWEYGEHIPRQYRTNRNAMTLIAARIRYNPHDMADAIGGVTWATMKFDIHSDAVHSALPLDCGQISAKKLVLRHT